MKQPKGACETLTSEARPVGDVAALLLWLVEEKIPEQSTEGSSGD